MAANTKEDAEEQPSIPEIETAPVTSLDNLSHTELIETGDELND